MPRLATALQTAAVLAVFLVPFQAGAQVIGEEVNPADFGISTAREATQKRYRYARVNPHALENSKVALGLFGDVNVNASGGWSETQAGNDIWTGVVEDEPFSAVLFARTPSGLLFGKVETASGTYLVQPKAGPVHAIVEIDPGSAPNEAVGDDSVPLTSLGDTAGKAAAESVCSVATSCPNQTIDVMVVYTPNARAALGGTQEAAAAAIAAGVAELNAANLNSGVSHAVRLVHTSEVAYASSGDASTDLGRLHDTGDGFMDEIHDLRNTYGADLVSLITDTGGCGIGYVNTNSTGFNSSAAFSVVRDDCLTGNKTLAHEMGHNMGLRHDWYVDPSTSPCETSHGYVNQEAFVGTDTSKRWRTIMAYNTQCSDGGISCSRLTSWSSPDNLYTGDPMGVPMGSVEPSDATFVLDRAACQVAAFRTAIEPPPTGATTVVFRSGQNGYVGARDTKLLATAATTNYGGATFLEVDGDTDKSILLYWDVTDIPAGATVTAASIEVNVIDASSNAYGVYESRRDWTEYGATWNAYDSGSPWQTPGANGSLDRGATTLGSLSAPSTGPRVVSLNADGVALVQSWINDAQTNRGLVILEYDNAFLDGIDFDSREATQVANRPGLSVSYVAGGANIPPTASFMGTPLVGAAPLAVPFDASSSSDLDGSIVSYAWDFGDTTTGSGVSPTHSYVSEGEFEVSLTVVDDQGGIDVTTGSVHVTPSGAVRFAVIGDWGDATNPAEADVANLVSSWNPEFVITTGDNNYPTGDPSTVDQNIGQYYGDYIHPYVGSYGSTTTTNRFFPSLGNHDWETVSCVSGVCDGAHFDYFELPYGPGQERYYDFVWGDVHFFAVDSDSREPDGRSSSSVQAQWLQSALASSTSRWNVVYFHHAAYTSGSHQSTLEMRWPFAAWGADVVMAGHDHTYERIDADGIVYYVNGLGGRSLYSFGSIVAGSQYRYNGDYGAMLVDADASTMTLQFITRSGAVIDSYTLGSASPPVAAFSGDPVSGGLPLTVQFSDESTNAPTSWAWTFGDGGSSSEQNPAHEYSAAGLYSISLTVSNSSGSDTSTRTDYIEVVAPPATPTDLVATATSNSEIELTWTDVATDEDGYVVERSPNGSTGWSQIVQLSAGAVSYTDGGLTESTTYHYRVYAVRGGMASAYSDVSDATTTAAASVDHYPTSAVADLGSLSGNLADLPLVDNAGQTLTERESGGKPSSRHSRAQATWTVPVRAGFQATLSLTARHDDAGDGDTFLVSWSLDGNTYVDAGLLSTSLLQSDFYIGITEGSTVWVRLEDTDRSPGHRALDQAFVDQLLVRTFADTGGTAPGAPTALAATETGPTTIDLTWLGVTDELGYRVERSTGGSSFTEVGSTAADITGFTDTGLAPSTLYMYRVVAFNASGSSPPSEVASATTASEGSIHVHSLTADVSGKKRWTMTVTAEVRDGADHLVSGALVTGLWGSGGGDSCTTDAFGVCSVSKANKAGVPAESFTVTDVTKTGYGFDPLFGHSLLTVDSSAPDALPDVASDDTVPAVVTMKQNYPNPFNPSTVIEYGLPARQHVSVVVYNVLGMEVARLFDDVAGEGWHRVTFDASSLPSGVYVAVTRTAGRSLSRVLLLTK